MLRKIAFGSLVLSTLALAGVGSFMIEYLIHYRSIRFTPAQLPIRLEFSAEYELECSVDVPAPYRIELRVEVIPAWDSLGNAQENDSIEIYLDSVVLKSLVGGSMESTPKWLVWDVEFGSMTEHLDDSSFSYYYLATDTIGLDSGSTYKFTISVGNVLPRMLGQPARLIVQMSRAWQKGYQVENFIRYRIRLYGLVAAGVLFVVCFIFWLWTRRRQLTHRSR